MIAKITAPPHCKSAINYITAMDKDGKKSTLLCHSDGILMTDNHVMAACLEAATRLGGHNLKQPIRHISLAFHAMDKSRMTDRFMERIAREYMAGMGITDTEFLIYRHHDKPYPHCHLLFSRVDRKGRVISDGQEKARSTRVCRELTMKHRLYMPHGKEGVNREALRGDARVRYRIMDKIMEALESSRDWKEFEERLRERGIDMRFHYNNVTRKLMGVSFSDGQHSYSGRQLDRSLVYGRLAERFGDIRRLAYDNVRDYYNGRRERILFLNSEYRHEAIKRALPEFERLFPRGVTTPSLRSLLNIMPPELNGFVDFDAGDFINSADGRSSFLSLGLMTAIALAPFNGPIVQCGGCGGGNSHGWTDDDDDRWKFRFDYRHYRKNGRPQTRGLRR